MHKAKNCQKMKKIDKKEKNFLKGYLQNAFYVINYGKKSFRKK